MKRLLKNALLIKDTLKQVIKVKLKIIDILKLQEESRN